ncbi:uncharacterized protein LOC119454001 [Dermacentor silvarum]|uniref:uncharacterized protein LOC119454001 n=1 Tax=Dermacentor silvarum TaxID=543639 RepID=UPI0021009AD4|nr:uncharacterized protein LOC119454001 [Dermacentor silvarum]
MVKRLKQLTKQKENDEIVPCKKVDIGGGVLVEEGIINQLTTSCHGGPGKFARTLLRHVFEESEMKGRSLFGAKGSHGQKEGLDPVIHAANIRGSTYPMLKTAWHHSWPEISMGDTGSGSSHSMALSIKFDFFGCFSVTAAV